ncbi:hypothetical protein APUTEX25_000947 [Auxenochlorella protothecoides]|uniref:Uncharacterized protein n=1 Tax=Auxenochlorella protothecoides TaxID=3075 RepID=A0A3M7KQL8_AUXPR|nr:hypothetical protein APUTEX25_000947 [Auxenochlorella protothecoides]|eukprot:RMZ52828.1 hypothetical protein APUTEX25_000947 [Auxenochlorella protothecoides]
MLLPNRARRRYRPWPSHSLGPSPGDVTIITVPAPKPWSPPQPPPPPTPDLIGYTVTCAETGEALGSVHSLHPGQGQPMLTVRGVTGASAAASRLLPHGTPVEHLVPWVPSIVARVDHAGRPSKAGYWYNQVTGRVSREAPELPTLIALADDGSEVLAEPREDVVMPSRGHLLAAGRYDLHYAVTMHGGYRAVGAALGRAPPRPRQRHLGGAQRLRRELTRWALDAGLEPGGMPTANQLLGGGRNDLYNAPPPDRAGRHAWRRVFRHGRQAGSQAPQAGQGPVARPGRGGGGVPGLHGGAGGDAARVLPSQAELLAGGRRDLVYALQKYGSAPLAAALGVARRSRGRGLVPPQAPWAEEG